MTTDLLKLLLSILLLYGTAELLLYASTALATSVGLSQRAIGLTVVAFGTSAPEVIVCLVAAFTDREGVAVGNVLGSNICNIGLVLGGAALLRPIRASRATLSQDLPMMLGATVIMLALAWDGRLDRLDGFVLFAGLLLFVVATLRSGRNHSDLEMPALPAGHPSTARSALLVLLALAGIAVAADLLVDSAVSLGRRAGVSELVIGLSVVAAGTSLPEAATAWLASARKKDEIGLGNVIGSNVFNIGAVLGLTAIVRPLSVEPASLRQDMPAALLFGIVLLPILLGREPRVRRREGLLLLVGYAAYILLIFAR